MRRFLIKKSSGGAGGSPISGSVTTFANLPPAASHDGELYYVQNPTGSIFLFNKKQAGLYLSDGVDWNFSAQYNETVEATINNFNRLGAEDFDILLDYKKGEFVRESGIIYSALGAVTPGAFNVVEWERVGDVTADANLGDNFMLRGDGAGKGIQKTGISVDDSDNITGVAEITVSDIPIFETLGNQLTTGIYEGGFLSANADDTLYDISDGFGIFVNAYSDPENPTYIKVTWSGLTGLTPTLGGGTLVFVLLNSLGTVLNQTTVPTQEQKRDLIVFGALIAQNGVNIGETRDGSRTPRSSYLTDDLVSALGVINVSGNSFVPASTDLTLRKEAGTYFTQSSNREISSEKQNNIETLAVIDPVTFTQIYNNGSGGPSAIFGQTNIDPDQWDDGSGTLATMTNNRWQNKIVWYFPSGNVFIQFGEQEFLTEGAAEAAIPTLAYTQLLPTFTPDVVRTVITVVKGATDLSDTATTSFFQTGKFGLGTAGGSAATGTFQDMQDTYGNSVNPEITTDATRGAPTTRIGSGADTDNAYEVENTAGTQVLSITGEGKILAKELVLTTGATIDEISTDGTLAGDSDVAVPTEKAVKTYADTKLANIVEDTTPQLGGTFDTNAKQVRFSKGADVASAAGLTLGTDGNYFDITGTTTITSIGTLAIGTTVKLHFDGILTLTHNATDLILPAGANYTTAAGDEFEFTEYTTGDWRCTGYVLASGEAIVGGGSGGSSLEVPFDKWFGDVEMASQNQWYYINDAKGMGQTIMNDAGNTGAPASNDPTLVGINATVAGWYAGETKTIEKIIISGYARHAYTLSFGLLKRSHTLNSGTFTDLTVHNVSSGAIGSGSNSYTSFEFNVDIDVVAGDVIIPQLNCSSRGATSLFAAEITIIYKPTV